MLVGSARKGEGGSWILDMNGLLRRSIDLVGLVSRYILCADMAVEVL